jgi:hypothetical protein
MRAARDWLAIMRAMAWPSVSGAARDKAVSPSSTISSTPPESVLVMTGLPA